MPEIFRDQLLKTIVHTFQCSAKNAEKIITELMMCARKKHMVNVVQILSFVQCTYLCGIFFTHLLKILSFPRRLDSQQFQISQPKIEKIKRF